MRRLTGFSAVFPTGVGMNLPGDRSTDVSTGVPHRRGDEPLAYSEISVTNRCVNEHLII